jgi:hypothetical protein
MITDSTITGNVSTFAGGGGIYNQTGTLTVAASTIAGNNAGTGGGGIEDLNPGVTLVAASIVAANVGAGVLTNCGGPGVMSVGNNLADDQTCGFNATGDLLGQAMLGPLGNNGGPTATMLPAASSPAVGKIPTGTEICGGSAKDQRGVPRPFPPDDECTIGATEAVPGHAPHFNSAASTTFTESVHGLFTVTTNRGVPTPMLTRAGKLPAGLTFADNGNGTATIAGVPARGELGDFELTITADNGLGLVKQHFTLAVKP